MESSQLLELGRSVKRLQHRHHRALDAALNEIGSTLSQWDALRAIKRNPDASSHHLAEATFMTDQSFGALASRLEQRGLVTRSAGKGRVLRHQLTAGGEEVLARGSEVAERVFVRSFRTLDETEKAQLLTLLLRLLAG